MSTGYILAAALCASFVMSASALADNGFKIGIEMQSMVKTDPLVEAALAEMGIGYFNYYANTVDWQQGNPDAPEAEVNASMMALAERLKLDFSISCHMVDPSDASIRAASASRRFRGVVIDEVEHARLMNYHHSPLADPNTWKTLPEAYAGAIEGYKKLDAKLKAAGAPVATATHVWPVLEHVAARAGFTVCPKICKELYSSVSFAIGMGAAKQYGTELWADVDLWFWDLIPGHSAEEMKCNLLMAYWLGADLVYIEGCGYNLRPAGKQGIPFSLVNLTQSETYQLTPHGEVLRWFCREYLPAHPRKWTFRDVRPNIAIVRFPDSCHGQRYVTGFEDNLYGSKNIHSDRDTEAWLAIWNLITFGNTGRDGLTFFKAPCASYGYQRGVQKDVAASYLTRPVQAGSHSFFVPLTGAVVYDHLAGYDLLKGVPLIFVTGKEVSDETAKAIEKCVQEGSKCVVWGPLAKRFGISDWKSGVKLVPKGKGEFIVTDDFQLPAVYSEVISLLGRPDEIRYRFGDDSVVLKRVTDNDVSVEFEAQPTAL